jgi:hypothetical protein
MHLKSNGTHTTTFWHAMKITQKLSLVGDLLDWKSEGNIKETSRKDNSI